MLGLFCRTGRYSSVNVSGRSAKCRWVAIEQASPGTAGIERPKTADREPPGLHSEDDRKPERQLRGQMVWPSRLVRRGRQQRAVILDRSRHLAGVFKRDLAE